MTISLNNSYDIQNIEGVVMPVITVSEYVKEKLDEIKKREQHTSFDSVIRMLLQKTKEMEKNGGARRN